MTNERKAVDVLGLLSRLCEAFADALDDVQNNVDMYHLSHAGYRSWQHEALDKALAEKRSLLAECEAVIAACRPEGEQK